MNNQRLTKYTLSVKDYIKQIGHGSNSDILQGLRVKYPKLSPTTIHRITSRMVDRRELALGPNTKDNRIRLDANLSLHDHFLCSSCDRLKDIKIPLNMFNSLQQLIDDCQIDGQLIIQGTCSNCLKNKEKI